jgi:molybdenum cofactor cytidylyltransferase
VKTTARVAAIVLAAGRSTRMGAENKLLADVGGKPMLAHAVAAALASRASPVLVVTGHRSAEVAAALGGGAVTLIENPRYADGLSTSLKAGIAALPPDCDGALVLLGDMPRITAVHLDRLIAAFAAKKREAIVVPIHEGRRGNPVLWPRACFAEMLGLEGDAGARRLLAVHADHVREVDLATDAIFADVDTPEELAEVRGQRGSDPSHHR